MRLHKILLASVGCLVLLTGCGGASPNVAATIGESSISMSAVNQTAADYCAASESVYEQNGVVLPMGTVRRQVLSSLVLREIADQMAEEFDVTAGEGYAQVVQQTRARTQTLAADERDAAITVDSTGGYLQEIAIAAAEADLAGDGVTGLTQDQVTERAIDLFANWSDRSPIELNPKFGIEFDQGQFVPVENGELSIGVSEDAETAQLVQAFENADNEEEQIALSRQLTGYARTLPESQRCG